MSASQRHKSHAKASSKSSSKETKSSAPPEKKTKKQLPIGRRAVRGVDHSHVIRPTAASPITDAQWELFLTAYAEMGIVTESCRRAGFERTAFYRRTSEDPEFATVAEAARLIGVEHQEDEVRRRAFEGYEKGVYYQGDRVDTETEYSDQLAMFVLRGEKPSKYAKTVKNEVTGKDGGPVEVNALSDTELEELLAAKLKALGLGK